VTTLAKSSPPLPTAQVPQVDPRYSVGTLAYTKASLVAMFVWMLCGSVAFTLMEAVFPVSMPLQLQRLGVPDAWMPVLMTTFAQVMNMFLSPVISFRSDRTRSRWGRRIPYIVVTLPFLCLCLVALGFTDEIGSFIRHSPWVARHFSPLTAVLLVIGALIVLFNFFNAFVNTVYWYLFADVVPAAFLGRFSGLSSLVGSASGAFFSFFVYGQIKTHSREVYLGAALLYLVGMGLLCWRVREGKYPAPTDEPRQGARWRRALIDVRTYFRECFCHPIYITYYLYSSLWAMTNACSFALIFFYVDYLGFSMDRMGKFNAMLGIAGMAIAFPLGWLVDKIHPMRAILIATVCMIPVNFAAFYMHSFAVYMIVTALRMPVSSLISTSSGPLSVQLMPRKQFGQFCSANDMVRSFVLIFASVAGGMFVGYCHSRYGMAGYAAVWLWVCVFDLLALLCMVVVWQYWRRMGGERFCFDPETRAACVEKDAQSA
jgi:MFS family permease